MLLVGILGCLVILWFVHLVLKDVMSPPFILSAVWLVMYILLFLFRKDSVDFSSLYYLSFLGGLVFFNLGFFLIVGNKNKVNCNIISKRKRTLRFKVPYIQLFLLLTFILFLAYLSKVVHYLSLKNTFNFWYTLSTGKKSGTFEIPVLIEYSRSAVIALSVVCSFIYFSNPSIKSKIYFYISGLIALFYVITAGNRGAIFMWMLSITFSYLIVRNFNNGKLIIIFSRLVLFILIIFIYTSLIKYVHIEESESYEFLRYILKHYFASSPIAFVEWLKSNNEYLYGANTFRFFIATYNSLFGGIDVPETVQAPINITRLGEETNVYTVLQYYTADFGLLYAFFIQFIIGSIHGFLYRKAHLTKTISPFYIVLQAFFYYPLLYQFFSDQYFTLLSSWLQYVFWIWFFTRKKFLNYDELK